MGGRITKKEIEKNYNKIIEKVLSKRKIREISKLSPDILETATIAHTQIQK